MTVAPSVQVTFCPFCNYSIYFSRSSEPEKNEIICPNCQVKYRVLMMEILRQGFALSKEELPQAQNELLTFNRPIQIYRFKCQNQARERKLLTFYPTRGLLSFGSQMNPDCLKSESGDGIAIFIAIPNRERVQANPVLVLNCINGQKLRLLSLMRSFTAIIKEVDWEIAIVENPIPINLLMGMFLGIIIFVIFNFLHLPMTTTIVVFIVSYPLLVIPFEKIVALIEHKLYQEKDPHKRERLVNEQNYLKSVRRISLNVCDRRHI